MISDDCNKNSIVVSKKGRNSSKLLGFVSLNFCVILGDKKTYSLKKKKISVPLLWQWSIIYVTEPHTRSRGKMSATN